MAAHNRLLGKFDLLGIPAAPRGVPQIEVTFDIDANGIINVSAKDMGTGKVQQIRVESSSGLTDAEIQKMVKDAELNAEKDKAEKEKIEVKNQADQTIFQTEKTLKELEGKISASDKEAIERALSDLKEKAKSDNIEAIKASMDALMKASHTMAEAMYKNAGGAQAGGAQGAGPGGNPFTGGGAGPDAAQQQEPPKQKGKDGAVDADFEVVN
jgi:molecular chaperone DnaK